MSVITKIPWTADARIETQPSLLARLGALLSTWQNRRKNRRALVELALHQPDSVLLDAHISRGAALREGRKPFWRA